MLALQYQQSVPTLGPEEGPGVNDPSILQSVMAHQVADNEFCQQLGLVEPPCLAPYAGQQCSCGRYAIDADHLHTCKQHSGNWYAAHERMLTEVEQRLACASV